MRPRVRLVQVERAPDPWIAPAEPWTGVRRWLLVPGPGMADLVLGLPAASSLRAGYPRAWAGVAVPPRLLPLAAACAAIDAPVPLAPGAAGLSAAVRRFRPDLLVSLDPGPVPAWVGRRERIAHRVGPDGGWSGHLYARRAPRPPPDGPPHEVEIRMGLAGLAGGAAVPARADLRVPPEAADAVDGWLRVQGIRETFVTIHPGLGGTAPSWPPTHVLRLAALLRAEGIAVVFALGPGDALAGELLDGSDLPIRRLPRFAGDLAGLAALLARSSVVVGGASGPVHLSAALGTPTLSLHAPGPFGPARRGPWAPNGWALVAEAEGGPAPRSGARVAEALLGAISPAAVLGCVLAMAEGTAPALR